MKTTDWKEIEGGKRRIRATYGFHKIGNQEPYFSITGEIEHKTSYTRSSWVEVAGGCLHTEIAEHFPELAGLIRWHLVFAASGPLHYIANAVFWWEMATGRVKREVGYPDPCNAFASTIVFGAIDGEYQLSPCDSALTFCNNEGMHALQHAGDVKTYLTNRLPALMAAMRADMIAAGVELPAAE